MCPAEHSKLLLPWGPTECSPSPTQRTSRPMAREWAGISPRNRQRQRLQLRASILDSIAFLQAKYCSRRSWWIISERGGPTLRCGGLQMEPGTASMAQAGPWATPWGVNGDIPVIGDYDGDGKTDKAVWRPSDGTWYVIKAATASQSRGRGAKRETLWFPATTTEMARQTLPSGGPQTEPGTSFRAAMINQSRRRGVKRRHPGARRLRRRWQDGLRRVAAVERNFYVIQSSNGQEISRAWGQEGDIPVPGDYDGDGKTDFAIWRPSNGTWFVILSGNGQKVSGVWHKGRYARGPGLRWRWQSGLRGVASIERDLVRDPEQHR